MPQGRNLPKLRWFGCDAPDNWVAAAGVGYHDVFHAARGCGSRTAQFRRSPTMSSPVPGGEALSGLAQLQAVIASGQMPGIGRSLEFALVEIAEGRAVFQGVPGVHAYNPLGTVHGGYAASLLDSACGCAVHSRLAPGQRYTTLELKVAYHRAMTAETGPVRAEGVVITFGRRAAFAEAKLTDEAGRILATATSTLLVMSE